MKEFFVSLIFLAGSTALSAQIQKGSVLLGGTVGFDNTKVDQGPSTTVVNISPAFGSFLSNRLALGSSFNMIFTNSAGGNMTTLGLTPFVRGYFNERGTERIFGQLSFGIQNTKSGRHDAVTLLVFGLEIGADFILNDHVAIEGAFGYQRFESPASNQNGFNNIGLNFGVVAFIDDHKN